MPHKVVVMYETGKVWVCELDSVGSGDEGEICAASIAVEILNGALIFEPAVMPWRNGRWRGPTGVVAEWTNSSPGFVDTRGERHDLSGGSVFSERGSVAEAYAHARYTLLTPSQLEEAVSITVDGVLAYSAENGNLVPTVGGGDDGGDDGGMEQDFATFNRPETPSTIGGMAHAQSGGIRYDLE